jgi:hypothetical protein
MNTYEISEIIPVQYSPTSKKEENNIFRECSLNENVFDPSKNSPPNDFMLKLQNRLTRYGVVDKRTHFY